jgi:putative endonuclease
MKSYFVYLLASRRNGTLYCGVTNNLVHRLWQHRNGQGSGFAAKYGVSMLVWFEEHADIRSAIHRETQIKRWRRDWKLKLIEDFNPNWRDLYDDLLPGAVRIYDKPPVVDHTRANPSRFDADDPFLRSFDTNERLPP